MEKPEYKNFIPFLLNHLSDYVVYNNYLLRIFMPESNFYEYSKQNTLYDCIKMFTQNIISQGKAIKTCDIDFWTEEKFNYPISAFDEYVLEDFFPYYPNFSLYSSSNAVLTSNYKTDFDDLPF